jgi:primosomal protein N' (replication factor Y)
MQPSLFTAEPPPLPPWEIDDRKNRKIAKVVFPAGYDAALDYLVPNHLAGSLEPGMRVLVPLGKGNRPQAGYCIDIQPWGLAETNVKLKPVHALLDEQRLIGDKMLDLTRWIAAYYLCPVGQVLEAVLPAGVRSRAGTRLTTVLFAGIQPQTKAPLTAKQQHVLETLRQAPEPLTAQELQRAAKCSAVPIDALKRFGFIETKTIRRNNNQWQTDSRQHSALPPDADRYPLTAAQQQALSAIVSSIQKRQHETFLLHGVTGSGKTEVYIQAIHEVVRQQKQAIVLVPEISLTPQTVGRFQNRFPHVAVLHSHLTDAERHRQWSHIAAGQVQVVVGARSAVFAPLPRLGLIVIDEEHENSFKQDSSPRYHARDVACKRAELEQIPLVLGSATPSLETWTNSITLPQTEIPAGDKTQTSSAGNRSMTVMLSMPHRVKNLPMPQVEIVDLREEVRNRTTRGAIHRQLHQAIHETLIGKGQIILLLNRRGFSTQIQCPACGEAVKCPHCDISLTHHKTEEIALCHYCDYQIPAPAACPQCRFSGIRYTGFGTQKLELEIKARFPQAAVLRMDTDTMQGPGAHERALSQFRNGNVQILLGTQMIAKGLDFPNVTLVGVINADTALHLPDFRASERTFHLITQVAGRTGRGEKGGRVIIQTFSPDHPAILAAAKHDYERFVRQELPVRKLLGYPPFSQMIRIVVRGENETKTFTFAKMFAERLAVDRFPLRILGPAPAPFAKLRNFYRFHIHLHSPEGSRLREHVRSVSLPLKTPPDVQWIIDVDPVDMQ